MAGFGLPTCAAEMRLGAVFQLQAMCVVKAPKWGLGGLRDRGGNALPASGVCCVGRAQGLRPLHWSLESCPAGFGTLRPRSLARVEPAQPCPGLLCPNTMAEAAAGGRVVSAHLVLYIYLIDESGGEPASRCSPVLNH